MTESLHRVVKAVDFAFAERRMAQLRAEEHRFARLLDVIEDLPGMVEVYEADNEGVHVGMGRGLVQVIIQQGEVAIGIGPEEVWADTADERVHEAAVGLWKMMLGIAEHDLLPKHSLNRLRLISARLLETASRSSSND